MMAQQSTTAFQKTTLPNGVRVLSEAIPSVRSISVGVWIDTGSRDEAPEEAGISHFIEHMVFKGTERRRMHHIARRLEAVGGYLNAFTSKEYTCFYARALDEHLERAVDTLCDIVLQPSFPAKEVEKEKDVVLEEMKMYEDTPDDLIFDLFEEMLYKGHALAHPILGYPNTVQSFSRDQLYGYMDRHYTLDRIVVAVAGNVAHDRVVALAEKAFAVSQRRAPVPVRPGIGGYEPAERVERKPIQQAHVVVGTRCMGVHDPKRGALTVLNTVLGGGMSSRLNQNIRERYGFCYNIYSFMNMHSDTGDFGVYMGTDTGKIDRAEKLILRELEGLAAKPVSPRTLNQAKAQVKGSMMLGQENMSNRMMRIGRQELLFGRYFDLDQVLEELDSVTEEEVQELARTLFQPESYSKVILLPQN